MNCASCGAVITSDQKRCAYCGTLNPEYERKHHILRGLERQKRAAEIETKRTFRTIWRDKLCNICLIGSIVLLVLSVGAVLMGIIIAGSLKDFLVASNLGEYSRQMEEYYDAGEYGKLHAYMSDNELFDPKTNYRNGQAALMYRFMTDFRLNTYPYIEYLDGGVDLPYMKSGWTILYDAQKVLCWGLSVYPDIHPDNQQMFDDYRAEIKDVFLTYLGLSDEEFEDCFSDDKFYKSEYDDILLERNDFIEN